MRRRRRQKESGRVRAKSKERECECEEERASVCETEKKNRNQGAHGDAPANEALGRSAPAPDPAWAERRPRRCSTPAAGSKSPSGERNEAAACPLHAPLDSQSLVCIFLLAPAPVSSCGALHPPFTTPPARPLCPSSAFSAGTSDRLGRDTVTGDERLLPLPLSPSLPLGLRPPSAPPARLPCSSLLAAARACSLPRAASSPLPGAVGLRSRRLFRPLVLVTPAAFRLLTSPLLLSPNPERRTLEPGGRRRCYRSA